jgi:hypothetical protein
MPKKSNNTHRKKLNLMLKLLQTSFASVAIFGIVSSPIPLWAATDQAPLAQQPTLLSDGDLDTLLAPIALYPDPLLAQILPASTETGDVVMAARYIASGKDVSKIDAQSWEESVKALAHYPDVLKMMDEKLDWTTHLGEAFLAQPEDVFKSVQRLRAKAQEVGNLKDNKQQVIVVEKEVIKIMPADPQVVYVPHYPPETVYVQQPVDVVTPLITFGAGLALGAWIHNEVDWHNHGVYYHNNGWNGHHGGGGYYGGGGNNINIDNSNNINIGNGNGNRPGNGNGSVWKPQNKPKPTPYGSGGNNGIANGNRPGGANGNGTQRPDNKPAQLPANTTNRPSGNKPQQQPSTRPAGQNKPSQRPQERPSTLPSQSGTRQNGGSQFQREATKPAQSMGNRDGGGGGARTGGGGRAGGGGGRAAGAGGGRIGR